jgi:ribosomal protein S3AE
MSNIDPQKAKKMIKDILETELQNLKTKKLGNDQIIEKIRKIIEGEVKKCY